MASLDEFRSQLEETAQGWTQQWLAEGVEKGRAEGRAEGVEQGRAEGVEKGRAEGVEKGRAEGVAAQRAGLRRQAALLFGGEAKRLDRHLGEAQTAARLMEIGEWLVVSTIDELIVKIEGKAAGRIR